MVSNPGSEGRGTHRIWNVHQRSSGLSLGDWLSGQSKSLTGIWELRAPLSLIWIYFSQSSTGLSLVFYQTWLFILSASSSLLPCGPILETLHWRSSSGCSCKLNEKPGSCSGELQSGHTCSYCVSSLDLVESPGRYSSVSVLQEGTAAFPALRSSLPQAEEGGRGWVRNWLPSWSRAPTKGWCAPDPPVMLWLWGWCRSFHEMGLFPLETALA